jgi:Co/Zn/Cd efflux system component
MRRWVFLFLGLALLLSAVSPAWEPLDRWDHSPTVAADTEFRVAAFAVGAGLAALFLLLSHHLLNRLRFSIALSPVLTVLHITPGAAAGTPCANGPPIPLPLRI